MVVIEEKPRAAHAYGVGHVMSFDANTLLSAQLHDLKNQMQSLLIAHSELEEALDLNPQQQSLLEKVHDHSHCLNHRLVELLSVLKMQNQSFQPNIDECWLMDTLTPIAKEFYELHGVNIDLNFDEDVNQFYDEQLLNIAVHNACMNAFQAGANTITINIDERPDGRWQLNISDDGPGFNDTLLNHHNHFTPSGTQNGLGLYLIEQALFAHTRANKHGEISIQNSPGKGAILSLIFP